jgi:hypothetical protein
VTVVSPTEFVRPLVGRKKEVSKDRTILLKDYRFVPREPWTGRRKETFDVLFVPVSEPTPQSCSICKIHLKQKISSNRKTSWQGQGESHKLPTLPLLGNPAGEKDTSRMIEVSCSTEVHAVPSSNCIQYAFDNEIANTTKQCWKRDN